MAVSRLKSWRIDSSQPFRPAGIRFIGDNTNNHAVITYAAHNVNTFIFRNFIDDIKNDKPPHKSYLHKPFFPERISDIIIGTNESVVLFDNGQIKSFTSTKTLMTVEYLSCIKSICATRNGFVLIKSSIDGAEFFVEFHPDPFHEQERKKINISFEKVMELQNTWQQSQFKIKELGVLRTAILLDICAMAGSCDSILFLSIDNNFCCLIVEEESYIVNILKTCTSRIVDFWSSSDGDYIMLFLESGAIEILYANSKNSDKISVHCGTNIQAHLHYGDMFFFSNNDYVECIMFEKEIDEFKFNRQGFTLPGIVAITYLPELKLILCISENCSFYSISLQDKKKQHWIEIDGDMQKQLANLKYELVELTDAYETVWDQQQQQKQIQNVIKLKQSDELAEINYRFVGYCSVMQTSPIQQPFSDDSFIYISNSLIYEHSTSFFVCISISYTTKYANEFDANLWRLCCRWLNDKLEHVYANIGLKKGQLSAKSPLTLIIHLKQKHLPNFHIDLLAVSNGSTCVQINFPVDVKQPNYCEMMNISNAVEMDLISNDMNGSSLISTISIPSSMSIDKILGE